MHRLDPCRRQPRNVLWTDPSSCHHLHALGHHRFNSGQAIHGADCAAARQDRGDPKFQERVDVLFWRFTGVNGPMPNQRFGPDGFHQAFEVRLVQPATRIQSANHNAFRPTVHHDFGLLSRPGAL